MHFDKVSEHYDKFMKRFGLYKLEELRDILELKGDEVILDVGGGTGYIASYLSNGCKKIYVLDESPKMLSKVKVNKKVIPIRGNALNLKAIEDDIDIVLLSDVFHHIKDQEALINSIADKLGKNKRVVLLDFDSNHYKTKILRTFEYLLFGKLYFKTKEEIKSLVKQKFNITKFMDYQYYFIISGEKR